MKRLIGVHDPLGAVLAHETGFDGVWVSGLEVSASLARPDRDLNSPDRLAQVVSDIRQVYDGPIYVDADSGFGGPLQASEAARRLMHAGATGLCIEDKVFPKTNSFSESSQILESIPEFSRKLRAMRRTVGPKCEIIARTGDPTSCIFALHSYVCSVRTRIIPHARYFSDVRPWGCSMPHRISRVIGAFGLNQGHDDFVDS